MVGSWQNERMRLSRYVHLNPVFVGQWKDRGLGERVEHLRSYPWSSYPEYVGIRNRWKFLEMEPVLDHVGGPRKGKGRAGRYREFVETGLAEDDREMREILSSSPLCIGGGKGFRQFIGGLHQKLAAGRRCPEHISFRPPVAALEPELILKVVSEELGAEAGRWGKGAAIRRCGRSR